MTNLKNFPFTSRYLTLEDGTLVHYVDEGTGIPILLLHGNPTWSFLYRHIITALKSNFRCIAVDYPGFGLSEATERYGYTAAEHATIMLKVVEKLQIKDFYIMMQDWGGPIGFYIAGHIPDHVRGFIIGNTWAWTHNNWRFSLFSFLVGGLTGQYAAYLVNGVVRLFLGMGIKSRLSREDYQMYLLPFKKRSKRKPTYIFPRQLIQAEPFLKQVEQLLPNLSDKPALLVWGEKDFAFKDMELRRFEEIFANHKTIMLPNAGHFVQEDAPNEISQAIKAWAM